MENYPDAWFVNLGIKINNLPRVAIDIFGFEIYWYAIIITIGIGIGILYAYHEAKRTGQDPETYIDFFFYAFISAIVGARLYYVIFSWDIYKDDLIKIFNTRGGGLAIYGGVIGGVLAAFVYSKVKKLNFFQIADTAAPALIIGQAIGRWGNFLNKEAYGTFTDSLFALRYKVSGDMYIPQSVFEKIINFEGIQYIQVHPTFLYESIWNLGVFIMLNILKKHKRFEGEVFLMYFVGYGIGRFFIEGLRTDQLIFFGTGLAVSQILSAVLVIISIVAIFYLRKRSTERVYTK